jgi:dihydropteroate synthase
MKPAVARAAVAAGATIWNDVTALSFAPDSLACAAALGCEVVLMHMQGEPRTMQDDPRYDDVVERGGDLTCWPAPRRRWPAGVDRGRIALDPGLGFGKTTAHNLALLAATPRLASHGFPVLVGASRKRFLAALGPAAANPADRLGGSIAAALWAADGGAAILRVHDVRETVQADRGGDRALSRRGQVGFWAGLEQHLRIAWRPGDARPLSGSPVLVAPPAT